MFRALATRSPFINFQQGKPLARAEYNEAGTKSPPLLPLSTSSGGSLKFQVGGVFGSNSEVAISRSIWRVPRWKERRGNGSHEAGPMGHGLSFVHAERTFAHRAAVAACQTAMSDNTKPHTAFGLPSYSGAISTNNQFAE